MSFRFRRTFSLLPGIRLNLGKSGASVSVGPKGAKITLGSKGIRATAGIPGTGMFFSQQIAKKHPQNVEEPKQPQLKLPAEVEEVIRERPPHWEFLLVQRALRSAVDDIDAMVAIASSHGTDAITFNEWLKEIPRRNPRHRRATGRSDQSENAGSGRARPVNPVMPIIWSMPLISSFHWSVQRSCVSNVQLH